MHVSAVKILFMGILGLVSPKIHIFNGLHTQPPAEKWLSVHRTGLSGGRTRKNRPFVHEIAFHGG
jgi:hypothetical protein